MVLLLIVSTIALMAISSVLNGWALTILWSWFVVPVFGLPEFSIPVAIGVSMTASFLTHQRIDNSMGGKDSKEVLIEAFTDSLIKPFMFLGIGYIVTLFI